MIRLDVLVFGFKKRTWGAISPCNHMYVLNGKIDECRHSSDISREQGRTRAPLISRGVVWSNRLGKLTKSRQLSARSWVTDFEYSHIEYSRMHAEISPSKLGLSSHPASGANASSTSVQKSTFRPPLLPTLSRLAQPFHWKSVLFYPDTADFPFRAFPFPRHALRSLELRHIYCNAFHLPFSSAWRFFPLLFSPLFAPPFPRRRKALPFKDSRTACLSIRRQLTRVARREIALWSMRR